MNNELSNNIFIARQPIFDIKQRVLAYEILFRNNLESNIISGRKDDEYSTMKVIVNTILNFGIKPLTDGKKAFINFGHELLTKEIAYIFPKNILGIEILESIEPDEKVIEASKKLKRDGYLLILDDFVFLKKFLPLLQIADIIKIETFSNLFEKISQIKKQANNQNLKFLAEKVESQKEYNKAKDLNYSYFQGFFFCKPEIISIKDIPGNKIHYLQLLKELNNSDLRIDQVENIMKREVSITYKLFRFINSANFGFKTTIKSIKHALNLLGESEIKKWLSFLVLSSLGKDKPSELINTTIIRAKFAEHISEIIGKKSQSSDFFLMGMFSLIDTMLGRPMEEILKELPINEEIKTALIGKKNIFKTVLDVVFNYERGNWETFSKKAREINCSEQELANFYFKSVQWAKKI